MKRSHIFILLIAIILFPAILASCSSSPGSITEEQAADIALPYFQKTYGKTVTVEGVKYCQTGMYRYRNIVWVSDEEKEYTLYLDAHNKPAFDDVAAQETVERADKARIEAALESLGMQSDMNLYIGFNYDEGRCSISFSAQQYLPTREKTEEIYALLTLLKEEKVDTFNIAIDTPEFLTPRMGLGKYGTHGIVLAGQSFATDISKASFEREYLAFAYRVYWDEQKFNERILELEQMGYKNVYFMVKPQAYPDIEEIILYCEAENGLSEEQAANLLAEMDETYFKIDDKETRYILDCVQK